LPSAWGWTPKLQLLQNLYLDQNPNLNATLPTAWGSPGGFSSLQVKKKQTKMTFCTAKDVQEPFSEPFDGFAYLFSCHETFCLVERTCWSVLSVFD